jgi:hypothetical protein
LNAAKLGLQKTLTALNLGRQSALVARDEYLEAQASMYDYLEQTGKAAIVRRLRKAEEIHRTYLKLQAIRRVPGSSGITELKVPLDPITNPKDCDPHWRTDAHVTLLNYAMKFSYSFERWQDVVNVMLMKEPGNPKIHRLCVIHLYEADYNLRLAVKWRQAMHHAEDSGYLNESLYGSRAGRSAHEPVFIEVLQNDIYMTSMKVGINYDLNATSCCDRILAMYGYEQACGLGQCKNTSSGKIQTED